jgi:uncharacterized membrane protein
MDIVREVVLDTGILTVTGDYQMCADGGLCCCSIDYYEHGRKAAGMAYSVLEQGEEISRMPIQEETETQTFYNPAIAVYEMLAESKLHYLLCLLLPLGLIPLLTKKKAVFAFLLPLLTLNLLSDFPYHFSLDFPYSFGISAFALYLTADGLAELTNRADKALLTKRLVTLAVCFTILLGGFRLAGFGLFTEYAFTGREEVTAMTDLLDCVEDGASVSASGRLVPSLAAREEIYYLHQGQLTEYVVIDLRNEWATDADKKYDEKYYTDKGYTVVERHSGVGVVLKKGN